MEKKLTRAEQRALEAYPVHKIGDQTSDYGEWDINRIERRSFQEGYERAEKDRALTVEDIKTILDISFWNDDPEKILEEYNRIKYGNQ